eukprot:2974330-Prymnesium_polylepis.2
MAEMRPRLMTKFGQNLPKLLVGLGRSSDPPNVTVVEDRSAHDGHACPTSEASITLSHNPQSCA